MTRALPAWRSLLYVPASAEKFVARAHERGADAIILDLEDGVAPASKPAARAGLAAAVASVRRNGADVLVRINRPLRVAVEDIAAAVTAGADALVCTKVMGPDHVRLLSELAAESEAACGRAAGTVRFVVLIEDAAALAHAQAIAAADPRVVALGVGGEDLATDLGAEPTPDALDLPKRMGLVAARAAGVLPLGFIGTVAGLKDLEGYRAMLRRSRAIGFACASCVHPSQVPIINEEYGPRPEEVERARRLVAAFEAALAEGRGAVAFEGEMIDKPIVERARRLIARAG
ncbi:CoA ester lyase [Roseomonas alkaliterrae]|uniref:Citrate lyase subunit beta/citryl-CoA lyase n=1 Tax=Neoroseomonas alkaliterrae TaxID=1452450 RepID=A0A840XSR2_9PROT|nr:citrate lyase subunit beta/citryl-CoA lyase [Neoroseomonas alkaliterrae]MBR0676533.1 CoA ester lyase [Neoroseomonas alkaliterrae]